MFDVDASYYVRNWYIDARPRESPIWDNDSDRETHLSDGFRIRSPSEIGEFWRGYHKDRECLSQSLSC
ncbi:MAG: hypothetical protein BAJATHORv1_30105 [Candidatus Thorarchaeota archaeon]|nr:MAG: hypothetical protein BAJATHORv1_30105 [Candidatus Thorarchaeota archaeon]